MHVRSYVHCTARSALVGDVVARDGDSDKRRRKGCIVESAPIAHAHRCFLRISTSSTLLHSTAADQFILLSSASSPSPLRHGAISLGGAQASARPVLRCVGPSDDRDNPQQCEASGCPRSVQPRVVGRCPRSCSRAFVDGNGTRAGRVPQRSNLNPTSGPTHENEHSTAIVDCGPCICPIRCHHPDLG